MLQCVMLRCRTWDACWHRRHSVALAPSSGVVVDSRQGVTSSGPSSSIRWPWNILSIFDIFRRTCQNLLVCLLPAWHFPRDSLNSVWLKHVNFASKPISVYHATKHGLRTPKEAFFHRNPKLLGLGRQLVQINFGAFGVFSADLSAPILVLWVLCPCFPLINNY